MNLKSKLTRLQAQTGNLQGAIRPSSAGSDLQRRLAKVRIDRITAAPSETHHKTSEERLAKQLKGYLIADGVIHIQQRIPLSGTLGCQSLSLLRNTLRLPYEGREAHLRQVYIDTETTGLSGGSGTLAFLIGLAVVEQDALVVTQYLITRFAGEVAMLTAFAGALTADDRLVSYNGKSFDLPLLIARYRMQGQTHPFDGIHHLDLLHLVRRLFKKRWPDCRLMTLEERLLGFRRQQDLPGSEAPAAWTDYVKQGRAEKLLQVVVHNRQDIASLALAHAMLVRAIELPQAHEVDIVALARWLSSFNRARAYTLLKSSGQRLNNRDKRLLAQWARSLREWEVALRLWQELAEKGCRDSVEQLAKYHEHISRDLALAKFYSEQMTPGIEQTRRLQRIAAKQYQQTSQAIFSGFLTDHRTS